MKKRVVFASIFALILCVSIIAGGTFALFTSEITSNIAITAGNVEITAAISDIKTYTFNIEQPEGSFELGGTAVYDAESNTLTLEKVAPADRVELNVNIENLSNIVTSYRIKVAFTGELGSGLVAKITFPGETDATVLSTGDTTSEWARFDADADTVTVPVSIELTAEAGNEYKNAVGDIIITVEAVQANGANRP